MALFVTPHEAMILGLISDDFLVDDKEVRHLCGFLSPKAREVADKLLERRKGCVSVWEERKYRIRK